MKSNNNVNPQRGLFWITKSRKSEQLRKNDWLFPQSSNTSKCPGSPPFHHPNLFGGIPSDFKGKQYCQTYYYGCIFSDKPRDAGCHQEKQKSRISFFCLFGSCGQGCWDGSSFHSIFFRRGFCLIAGDTGGRVGGCIGGAANYSEEDFRKETAAFEVLRPSTDMFGLEEAFKFDAEEWRPGQK